MFAKPTKRNSHNLPNAGILLILTTLLLLAFPPADARGQEGDTFQSLLQKSTNAFQSGQYEAAADFFDSLELQFSEEDDYISESLQKILLPMRGYCLLRTDQAGQAAEIFEYFLLTYACDVTAENTTIASESLSGEITGKTYETKKIHT